MRVIEQFIAGKHPDQLLCEDAIVVHGPLVAVIDGMTDKSGKRINTAEGSVTSGRFAATVLAEAVRSLDPGTEPAIAVSRLTAALAAAIDTECGFMEPHERPGAFIALLDASTRMVWRVGDCNFRIDEKVWIYQKRIDQVTSDFRAAYLASLPTSVLPTDPASADPGREVILPLLKTQGYFANTTGEFGFGVLNGEPVPEAFIEVVRLPDAACEVVLASDGYPALPASLAAAEEELARLLVLDPTCVGPLRSTKGLQPGMHSFDDRCWVRIALDASS